MTLKNNLLFTTVLILTIFLYGCKNSDERKIVVYTNCNNIETYSDLNLSINNDFIKNENIELEIDTIKNLCGYKLIKGNNSKNIDNVMTDYDLMLEITEFYNIK